MVPKIIHACWFGGPLTPLARRCRDSWRQFAPDFELREHGEELLAVAPPFAKNAAAAHQWAMVSDWARMHVLYETGGIYLDFDVELIAPLTPLLALGEFVAGEKTAAETVQMNPGSALALMRKSPLALGMLEKYKELAFDPQREMMDWINAALHEIAPSLRVLPPEVFSPIDLDGTLRQTEQTLGIHHYAMSWASPQRRFARWLSWHGFHPLIKRLLHLRAICRH